ncbi:MAG: hypothetical protein U9Q90_04200, partial [Campylobacterota bacterium]|nr:hypothetical protein [Campylobacterota bacterium]
MKQKYLNHFIFGLLAVMITVALSMHYMVAQSTENLKNEEIKRTAKYAEKIAQFILLETNGKIESALDKDKVLRKKLNEALFAFMTEEFRYIFLLLKDPKGIYRFLLDGSLEDPAEYKMPFFPKSNQYDTVYMMQNPQIIKRSEGVDQVWVSLVYPIIDESETALLVMDLSKEYGQYLNEFHSPLEFVVRLMN